VVLNARSCDEKILRFADKKNAFKIELKLNFEEDFL